MNKMHAYCSGKVGREWGRRAGWYGTTLDMVKTKSVVPRPSPESRVRRHGVQVQVRCDPRLLQALDAARELERFKPSRPEMLRRLARNMLEQRGLLKIPDKWPVHEA